MTSGDQIRPDWVPGRYFRDPELPRLEKERLWPRVWQMACRESELKAPGDFVNYEILDDAILIVRTGDGADDIVAFYNVCQHRGRKLREEYNGNLGGGITCRFHGWRYALDGRCIHVHAGEDWAGCPDFDINDIALPPVHVARWGGWIWINQDEDPPSLQDYLGIVPEMLDPFEPEAMHPVWWKTIDAPVNWKVVVEAFNESYHALATHIGNRDYPMNAPSTAHGLHSVFRITPAPVPLRYRDESGKWVQAKSALETLWAAHRITHTTLRAMTLEPTMAAATRLRDEGDEDAAPADVAARMWDLQQDEFARRRLRWPPDLTRDAVKKAGSGWQIFPNSLVLPTVDGALWYRIRPHKTDADRCLFDIWCFGRFPPGEEAQVENELYLGFDAFRGQNPFLEQDFANMAAVNAGMKMRGWRGARTNPVEEVSVNHFRRTIAEFLSHAGEGR